MSEVLLLGTGPLPLYSHDRLYAFGVRTWHFARCLLDANIKTTLVTFEFGSKEEQVLSLSEGAVPKELNHVALPEPNAENLPYLVGEVDRLIAETKPRSLVTAGSNLPAQVAIRCSAQCPLWVDLFGDMMTEVQAKLAFAPAAELDFFLRLYYSLLVRGDCFSTVSEAQKDAVIGQLSMVGRLTGATRDFDLVRVIPVSFDERESPTTLAEPRLRGKGVSRDDFIVLWSGGFNTWADVPTLFEALERAMAQNPRIHFAASGGSISGHHEEGFKQFVSLVQDSAHKDRFHILGWLPNDAIAGLYAEADIGINVDLNIYEARLGSRCRIVNWMRAGLPCLTTRTTELSRLLEANQAGFVVSPGDPDSLADAMLQLTSNRSRVLETGARAQFYATENFAFAKTIKPLLEWVGNPMQAPDRDPAFQRSPLVETLHALFTRTPENSPRRQSLWSRLKR